MQKTIAAKMKRIVIILSAFLYDDFAGFAFFDYYAGFFAVLDGSQLTFAVRVALECFWLTFRDIAILAADILDA